MQAEIIAVGTELLGAERLDTNSLYLTRELRGLGIRVIRKCVLPDEETALAAAIAEACRRTELVLCTGGLGPTADDRTRDAAASALGCGLERDPVAVERLRLHFERRHRPMAAINLVQADRLEPAEWLWNDQGSAPGQWCPTSRGFLILLPGPPQELEHIFAAHVHPRLAALACDRVFFTRVLSLVGLPESEVETIAEPIYREFTNPETTILATGAPQVELHLHAWGATPAEAVARAQALADRLESHFGEALFSRDGERLEAVVGSLLRSRGQTVAVAESCTGGGLGELLTATPGASDYFSGGVICYSNAAKQKLLGVQAATLARGGAVSAACACEMAAGARERLESDFGLAITGIAGPGGGSADKPVGTVFIGLSQAGCDPEAVAFQLGGTRERIRRWSAQNALNLLRLRLLR